MGSTSQKSALQSPANLVAVFEAPTFPANCLRFTYEMKSRYLRFYRLLTLLSTLKVDTIKKAVERKK
jgi:hypothetical protein